MYWKLLVYFGLEYGILTLIWYSQNLAQPLLRQVSNAYCPGVLLFFWCEYHCAGRGMVGFLMSKYAVVEKIPGSTGDSERFCGRPAGRGQEILRRILGETMGNPGKTRPRLDKWTVAGLAEAVLGVGRRKKCFSSFIMGRHLRDIRLFRREP